MSTPPNKATANTNSTDNLSDIQAAANQIFIDDATLAINAAIAQGVYKVQLLLQKPCDPTAVNKYFVDLGYAVSFPGLDERPAAVPAQPAELFGEAWDEFWAHQIPPQLTLPAKILISWA